MIAEWPEDLQILPKFYGPRLTSGDQMNVGYGRDFETSKDMDVPGLMIADITLIESSTILHTQDGSHSQDRRKKTSMAFCGTSAITRHVAILGTSLSGHTKRICKIWLSAGVKQRTPALEAHAPNSPLRTSSGSGCTSATASRFARSRCSMTSAKPRSAASCTGGTIRTSEDRR